MIELKYIITNGYVDRDTIEAAIENGWTFVATVPAKSLHPYAMDTDKATIFSKYVPYDTKDELPETKG